MWRLGMGTLWGLAGQTLLVMVIQSFFAPSLRAGLWGGWAELVVVHLSLLSGSGALSWRGRPIPVLPLRPTALEGLVGWCHLIQMGRVGAVIRFVVLGNVGLGLIGSWPRLAVSLVVGAMAMMAIDLFMLYRPNHTWIWNPRYRYPRLA